MYYRPVRSLNIRDFEDEDDYDDIECSWNCTFAVLLVFLFFGLVIFVIFFSVYLAQIHAERVEIAADDRKHDTLFIELRDSHLNSHTRLLFHPSSYRRHLRRKPSLNVDRSLSVIHGAINKFINKCDEAYNSTEGLPFKYIPGSVGIVTTCKLNALCVTSLLFAYDQTNGTLPIELWLERFAVNATILQRLTDKLGDMLHLRFFDEVEPTFVGFFGEKIPFYRNSFALKTLVMVSSSFQHIIWMDGDVMFVRDPRIILENPAVKSSGMCLWRDMACIHVGNPIWRMMQAEARAGMGGESGVVYVNKEIAWKPLYLAAFMNQNQHVFYRVLYGDKDTYFLAAERLNHPYYMLPYNPIVTGNENLFGFLQAAPDGFPLFVHLAGDAKMDFNESIYTNRRPFTKVLSYDPERSHLEYTNGHFFHVVSDWRTYVIPEPVDLDQYVSNKTLDSFVPNYLLAEKLVVVEET